MSSFCCGFLYSVGAGIISRFFGEVSGLIVRRQVLLFSCNFRAGGINATQLPGGRIWVSSSGVNLGHPSNSGLYSFRKDLMSGFLLSQEYLCLKSSIFLCECLMVFYPRCAALCHGIQLQ